MSSLVRIYISLSEILGEHTFGVTIYLGCAIDHELAIAQTFTFVVEKAMRVLTPSHSFDLDFRFANCFFYSLRLIHLG